MYRNQGQSRRNVSSIGGSARLSMTADLVTLFDQIARARQAGESETHHQCARLLRLCHAFGTHAQRSFNVASPINTRMKLMIQKRTMTRGSGQPFNSKWWCNGAMRNMRFAGQLEGRHLHTTDTVSMTNTPP